MDTVEQEFSVTFRYPVYFADGVFTSKGRLLNDVLKTDANDYRPSQLFVVDSNVAAAHPSLISTIEAAASSPLILPGGEAVKNDPVHLEKLYKAIAQAGLCRQSYLIAIGGGALLDLAGYAAATAHRGIRHIRMPTTVLSQADSGVGVKNGINTFARKNFLGTFAPPYAVINDFHFLTTLSGRDWRAGIAEAVKVALIKDASLLQYVNDQAEALCQRNMQVMRNVVKRTATLHLQHIATSGDPFELGTSRPLDFGHWSAHKLEQMTDYDLRHGEAVSIGMALDSVYSMLIGELSESETTSIVDCLKRIQLPIFHEAMLDHGELLTGLDEFREHLGGPLTIALLRGVGRPFDAREIDRVVMVQAVQRLEELSTISSAASDTIPT